MEKSEPQLGTRSRRARWMVLAMVLLLIAALAWTFFVDIPPIDDSDLRVPPPTGPDSIGLHLLEAIDGVGSEEILPGWTTGEHRLTDPDFPQAHIDALADRIAALERALDGTSYAPEDRDGMVLHFRDLELLAFLASMDAYRREDLATAVRFLEIHRHFRTHGISYGQWKSPILRADKTWIPLIESTDDPELLRSWLPRFEGSGEPIETRALRIRNQYELLARGFDQARVEKSTIGPFFRTERTRAILARAFRANLAALRAGEPLDESVARHAPSTIEMLITGNAEGMKQIRLYDSMNVLEPIFREEPRIDDAFAITAIGLRLHLIARGTLPETLAALVPEFLPALPADPFDPGGAPLRWNRETRFLWSIGQSQNRTQVPSETTPWMGWEDFVVEVSTEVSSE